MKLARLLNPSLIPSLLVAAASLLWIQPALQAKDSVGAVVYSQPVITPNGVLPFDTAVVPRTPDEIDVTAPTGTFPVGTTSIAVTVTAQLTGFPAGADSALALNYVSFSTSVNGPWTPSGALTLTFTSPGQTLPLFVRCNFPVSALPVGTASSSYTYQIFTNGWPAAYANDQGTSINATLTSPTATKTPPVVAFDYTAGVTPANNSTITASPLQLTGLGGLSVPFAFTSNSTGSGASAIDTIDARLGGISVIPLSNVGLNTTAAYSNGTLHILLPGTYSITAIAHNQGGNSNIATTTFTVAISGLLPPTVAISSPTPGQNFDYIQGQPPVSFPVTFTGTATFGTISNLTAVLDDTTPITFTTGSTLNTAVATGTGALSFSLGGSHTIKVSATDSYGQTVYATTNFTINYIEALPAIAPVVDITTPTDEQEITVPYSSLDAQGRASVPLSFTGTANTQYPVTKIDADVDGTPVVQQTTNGAAVTGTGTMLVKVGAHTITAHAQNSVDISQDVNDFTVIVTGAPLPVVTIAAPLNGSTKLFALGATPYVIPFNFTAKSVAVGGLIRTVIATLDGSTAPLPISTSALNSQIVTGSLDLSFAEPGTHTVSVLAVDDYGNAVATSTFTIVVADPTPVIVITPISDVALTYPAITANVPFTFKTSTASGFTIDSVSAVLDGVLPLTFSNTPVLGTSNVVTSAGTIAALAAGTHTIAVTGTSAGKTVTTSTSFKVVLWTLPPPSVVITAPTAATFEMTGTSLSIPLNFTGTSNYTGGTITGLTATLKNVATGAVTTLTVSSNTPQKIAYGTATMNVTTAGTYTITVTAKDVAAGTATATQNFAVTVVATKKISGNVFFDVDFDGTLDCGEFGLSGVTVTLYNSANAIVATTTADCGGDYSFSNVAPGTYKVTATAPTGLVATPSGSTGSRSITITNANVTAAPIGFGLNFTALRAMSANGYTIGFWKNNVDKAIAGKSSGTQIPNATVTNYTKSIGSLALSPYDNISMKTASSTMGSTSSASKDLLSKQLVASEYNYVNGAYLNGNKTLTFLFIWWGEYVLQNSTRYTSTQLIWTKDWFDAYNNSHGGVVAGPQ
jgi:hypothetical protein